MAYEKFLQANDTIEKRIEAMLSVVSPDPKGIALWSMEGNRAYTMSEIYTRAKEFAGGWMPIRIRGIWQYYDGTRERNLEGSLHKIGAVVEVHETILPWSKEQMAYLLTDSGEDIGKPADALATRLVSELDGKVEYTSMWRLIGAVNSSGKTRRMSAIYGVIEELIKVGNPLREEDIIERTSLNPTIISQTLNALGFSYRRQGIISYDSPFRDLHGLREKGWARYKAKETIVDAEPEYIYQQAKSLRKWFHSKSNLFNTLNIIKGDIKKEYTGEDISKILNINITDACICLSILCELEYLESKFQGRKTQSLASLNDYTKIFWDKFLEPIGIVAQTMDTNFRAFRSAFEEYYSNPSKAELEIRRQLEIYNKERSHIGQEGGEIIMSLILSSLTGEPKKASQIVEEVNLRSERKLKANSIARHLRSMTKKGIIRQSGKAYYSIQYKSNEKSLIF